MSRQHDGGRVPGPGFSLERTPSPLHPPTLKPPWLLGGATPPLGWGSWAGWARSLRGPAYLSPWESSVASNSSPRAVADSPTPHFSIWCPFFLFYPPLEAGVRPDVKELCLASHATSVVAQPLTPPLPSPAEGSSQTLTPTFRASPCILFWAISRPPCAVLSPDRQREPAPTA